MSSSKTRAAPAHWSDELYQTFVEIAGYMNRPDIDAAFLERAGVKLESALFPLLCRIGVLAPVGVVDLADAIGRDHSTISRQVAKLESLGLVERSQAPDDQRVRLVRPSPGRRRNAGASRLCAGSRAATIKLQ